VPVHRGRVRQPVVEHDRQLRPAHRFEERARVLPVEGVHRVAATLEGAPDDAGLEMKRVAALETHHLSGPRGGRVTRRKEGADVGAKRHLGRKHGEPRRHGHRRPAGVRRPAVPLAVRLPRPSSRAHASNGELEEIRREQPGTGRLPPQHHLALGLAPSGVALGGDEDDELLQVHVAEHRAAIGHLGQPPDRMHGRRCGPGHVGGEPSDRGRPGQPSHVEHQAVSRQALGGDGNGERARYVPELYRARCAFHSGGGDELDTVEIAAGAEWRRGRAGALLRGERHAGEDDREEQSRLVAPKR